MRTLTKELTAWLVIMFIVYSFYWWVDVKIMEVLK